MSSFDFANLTPDLILDAIESIGIYPESGLLALNSYENRVYQFKADNGFRYVVKFYRPNRWSEAQIKEEHQFCQQLIDEEILVATPEIINGDTLHNWQGYPFSLFKSLGGRMFELDNLDQLEWLGRLLGRIHKSSGSNSFAHRLTINFDTDFAEARAELTNCNLIPDSLRTTFFHDMDMMIELCLPRTKVDYQAIKLHGDCHAGNILWQQSGEVSDAILVDFDDCITGPAVQDLWMMLNGDRANQLLQLDTMLCAYEEFADFNHQELQLIEPLRARRMVCYMAWIAKRWQDNAFQTNFSWFATEKYWEQQILAIKEQIAALNEEPLKLLP